METFDQSGLPLNVPFLTTREAAQQLGVALRTAQLWVESGTLVAWKTAGGHRRITQASVDAVKLERMRTISPVPGPVPTRHVPGEVKQNYHILVVDDDSLAREIMVGTLRSWGLNITVGSAEDGFAALLYIGEKQPSLLLTDLVMPAMDGFRMIRHLRALPEHKLLDIIAVTARDPADIAAGALLPADVPVLSKPVSFPLLRRLIDERMHRFTAQSR